jgi:hypothetical protein
LFCLFADCSVRIPPNLFPRGASVLILFGAWISLLDCSVRILPTLFPGESASCSFLGFGFSYQRYFGDTPFASCDILATRLSPPAIFWQCAFRLLRYFGNALFVSCDILVTSLSPLLGFFCPFLLIGRRHGGLSCLRGLFCPCWQCGFLACFRLSGLLVLQTF